MGGAMHILFRSRQSEFTLTGWPPWKWYAFNAKRRAMCMKIRNTIIGILMLTACSNPVSHLPEFRQTAMTTPQPIPAVRGGAYYRLVPYDQINVRFPYHPEQDSKPTGQSALATGTAHAGFATEPRSALLSEWTRPISPRRLRFQWPWKTTGVGWLWACSSLLRSVGNPMWPFFARFSIKPVF